MNDLYAIVAEQQAERRLVERMEAYAAELREAGFWDQVGYDEPGWSEIPSLNRLTSRRNSPYSYIHDRQDGRYLPYYENEWELRRMRAACRNIAAFTSVAIGALNTLDGYVIKTGYQFKVKAREESQEESLSPLVDELQRYVDQFLKESKRSTAYKAVAFNWWAD